MSRITRRQFVLATSAMLVPKPAMAQSTKKVRLGLLEVIPLPPLTNPFFEALRVRGWVVGRNLDVETRATGSDPSRALALARELVEQGVDVLVTVTTANARAAKQASRSVPIVMLASGYPVESGLVASLARPGGNVTGLASYAGTGVWGKYVAFLAELVPSLREMGVLFGYAPPAYAQAEADLVIDEMRRAAELL